MKTNHRQAFTLVELLVVIAIIGTLAALLMPALIQARITALKRAAKIQMHGIVTAIEAYDQAYGHYPVSKAVQDQANLNAQSKGNPDFTYGGNFSGNKIGTLIAAVSDIRTNAEVIAILMDYTNYPGTSTPTINVNHQSNPKQTHYLEPKLAADTTSAGVGPDLVYRDPWGNPYVISLDLNYDNQCNDAFYGLAAVSQNPPGAPYVQTGYNGLFNPNASPSAAEKDNFLFHGKIMVWSAGPDGKIDLTQPANQGVNKDNLLSWQ